MKRQALVPRPLRRAVICAVLDEDTVRVAPPGGGPWEDAELAVFGYAPRLGDGVLVERVASGLVVLGVFGEARRRSALGLDPAGDLVLRAPGRVRLEAGAEVVVTAEHIRLSASELRAEAGRFELEAGRIVEHAEEAYRHVEGLSEVQAGRARTLIEGTHDLTAAHTNLTSEGETRIDGKRVFLG